MLCRKFPGTVIMKLLNVEKLSSYYDRFIMNGKIHHSIAPPNA
jgi:hypothetical protein